MASLRSDADDVSRRCFCCCCCYQLVAVEPPQPLLCAVGPKTERRGQIFGRRLKSSSGSGNSGNSTTYTQRQRKLIQLASDRLDAFVMIGFQAPADLVITAAATYTTMLCQASGVFHCVSRL